MSLAAETRAAVRARPFLLEGLRAGVVNYAAAARTLDVAEDTEAVATALRRFAERLPEREAGGRRARVTMHGGLVAVDSGADAGAPLLSVGGRGFVEAGKGDGDAGGDGGGGADAGAGRDGSESTGDGPLTGVLATGEVDPAALAHALGVLAAEGVAARAAGVAGESMLVVVDRRDGPATVRAVEAALDAVPEKTTL